MKYVAPYGINDPEGAYVNGDPSIGRQGSIPPAAAFEHPMREIVAVIDNSNLVPTDADLLQLTKGVRSQYLNFVDDTGTANTLTVALDPPLISYTLGLPLRVRVKNTNTGAVTIDAGAGRVNIRRPNGSAVEAGDLTASGVVELVYDGTAFQMVNYLGRGGTGGTTNNFFGANLPYCVDTSPTANQIIAPFSPAITTVVAGDAILVRVANSNTAATTIKINAMAPVNILATGGGSLLPQDVLAGGVFILVFDGTNFYVDPNPTIDISCTVNVPTTQFNKPADVFKAFRRKLVGPGVAVTVQLAAGIYEPFAIDHVNSGRFIVKGTMIGSWPSFGSFAQSGASAAQRASDGAINLAMLRSRYGTEVRMPPGYNGTGVSIPQGTFPALQDILVTSSTNTGTGVGHNSVGCTNVAVSGCYVGFWADATGNVILQQCHASNCTWGFDGSAGGTLGMESCGAYGCGAAGVASESQGLVVASAGYSRCSGSFNWLALSDSMIEMTGCDGIISGAVDVYAGNSSLIVCEVNATTFSPALGVEGNYNSLIITG